MNESLNLKRISSKEINFSDEIKETDSHRMLSENPNLYSSEDHTEEEECSHIIAEFTKINKCSILKYGISLSAEKIKFGYCHTCDTNLMYPICLECLIECHRKSGHDTREIEQPDFILCGCGERMHKFKECDKKNKDFSAECPYNDWCEKSLLSTLYIVDEKCICEFCYRMCGYEGMGRPLEKEREMLQV